MDKIDKIISVVQDAVRGVSSRIDRSENARGPVWVDFVLEDQAVCVDWRQGMPLGLTSLPTESYGEAADEIYESIDDLAARIKVLFETRTRTASPREALLSELRSLQRISQEDLARLLKVSQPSVSKLEGRDDMSIRRLRAAVEAIGGRLEITAQFRENVIRLSQFDDVTETLGSSGRRPA